MPDKIIAFSSSEKDPARLDEYIKGCAEKDTDSLSRLYGAVSSSVYAYALSVLKNRQDAEDVLHDCFINIFSAAPSYISRGRPMAWIMTICRNLCMNTLKERGRRADTEEDDWEAGISEDPGISPDDRLTLRFCMDALSEEERKIVILHAVSGFKHREIAEFLDMPLATVLSKYARSVKKLRTILEKEISP